ncbi:hypothetical protein EC957_007967, partial [Mortierella hygrophila]
MTEIEKILGREDTLNDFIPLRQAMDSDEFDWGENVNINGGTSGDCNGKKEKKGEDVRSTWRQSAPFLRMIILIVAVAPILALPTVLTGIILKAEDDPQDPDRRDLRKKITKNTVVLELGWLAFMWCIICINNWVIDLIPTAAVMVCSWIAPTKVETLKLRLVIFVAAEMNIK